MNNSNISLTQHVTPHAQCPTTDELLGAEKMDHRGRKSFLDKLTEPQIVQLEEQIHLVEEPSRGKMLALLSGPLQRYRVDYLMRAGMNS